MAEQILEAEEGLDHSPMSGRYSDAPWWEPGKEIIIGGLGNIGGHLIFIISKLEPSITVYDFDKLEDHNIGVSPYRLSDIGLLKTHAANNLIREHSGIDLEHIFDRYDEESFTGEIVFSCFDNMAARKAMFDNWLAENGDNPKAIFIDGRSSVEFIQVYSVRGGDKEAIKTYQDEFFTDEEEIPELSCNYKSSFHMGSLIASLMVTSYTNHLTNVKFEDDLKDVPFYVEFEGPSFGLERRNA